ncbi:hypothetical protein [Arthrobacter sp. ISL-95]|uniref:hypothetical protein n=1 Tax=Arthrobacter sp. ISL-95 TaxID=2819116 RepID=UPI001BEB1783|nr:hypothetical protein [Arthrobacter sp. ISL-95]MBT2585384.1 hypothetical protein [Arthrobacter sp. ISL-95]
MSPVVVTGNVPQKPAPLPHSSIGGGVWLSQGTRAGHGGIAEVSADTVVLTGTRRRALDSTVLDDPVARQDTLTT